MFDYFNPFGQRRRLVIDFHPLAFSKLHFCPNLFAFIFKSDFIVSNLHFYFITIAALNRYLSEL